MKKKETYDRISDLKKYGKSSLSYLTLSKKLSFFRGKNWKGYFAYKEFFSSVVILGDPIIPEESLDEAIDDLINTFTKNKKHISFFLCTDNIVNTLFKKEFKVYFFGKEAVIDLNDFNISGKKGWSIRSSVNYARRNNMIVEEYKYQEKRNVHLENAIKKISNEWCKTKNEPELDFAFGHVNFDDYKNIRYFICKKDTKEVGFIVYYPIFGINSYYLDLSRRANDSPRGTIDFLHYKSLNKLKKEGVKKIYIGLSPLSYLPVDSNNKNHNYIKLLSLIRPLLGLIYPFESEFFYKNKFATDWEPNYICFYPRISIRNLFSLLHSVYNGGFAAIFIYKFKTFFKNLFH